MNKRILATVLSVLLLLGGCVSTTLKEAHTAYEGNRYVETIALCRQAIANDSTDIQAYLLLSKAYRRTDSLRQALYTVNKARKIQAGNGDLQAETARVYRAMGQAEINDGQDALAVKHLEVAAEYAPKDTAIVHLLAEANWNLGRMDEAQKHYEALLEAGADTSQIQPRLRAIEGRVETAEARLKKAVVAYNAGKLQTAKKLLDQVLQAKADDEDALYYHYMTEGRLLYEAGQYVYKQGAKGKLWDAIVALGNAATYRETAAEPHYYMGLAYEKKDKDEYDNAIAAYEKALTLEPNGPKAATCKKKINDLKKHKEKMDKFWGRKR